MQQAAFAFVIWFVIGTVLAGCGMMLPPGSDNVYGRQDQTERTEDDAERR